MAELPPAQNKEGCVRMVIHPPYRRPLVQGLLLVALCLAALAAAAFLPWLRFSLPQSLNVALHTGLELASVAVALLVFAIGWTTFDRGRGSLVPVASSVFLATGLLDFVHLMVFEGMPMFDPAGGVGEPILAFFGARALVALAMVAIAAMSWSARLTRPVLVALFAGSLLFALGLSAWSLLNPGVGRLFYEHGSGLTPLKIGFELAIIALNLLAAAGFLRRMAQPQSFAVVHLFTASLVMALSELCFTLYSTSADQYINLGHVLKLVAYVLVFHAMFAEAVRKPYGELEQAQAELRASEERLLRLNATLEQRVRQRTAQLEVLNGELEAFSYSVAHDLRAPLAAIDGFAEALGEQLQGRLEAHEQRYLERIGTASRRMADMIAALLELGRLSCTAPQPEPIDLAALARGVLEELRMAEPQRAVAASVPPRLPAEGDPRLLRLALQNLIGNAWKFTARRPDARIELGCEQRQGRSVYYVRDNGAGFDMEGAGRLFAAFQRLHGQSEYPGHGVGLANVRRIVHLHGGTIWAEARPQQGATFWFTLGAEASADQAGTRLGTIAA